MVQLAVVTSTEQELPECTNLACGVLKALANKRELDYTLGHTRLELLVYTGFHVVIAHMVESIRTMS
jgi:hypothetical protein